MKSIGGLMVLLGVGSFALNAMNMEFTLLSWIDNWGPTVSLGIKIGLAVVGAILWFVGHSMESKATPAQQSTQHSGQTSGETFGE